MSGKSKIYCCVPQCRSGKKNDQSLTFHQFPKAGRYRVVLEHKIRKYELVDARKAWEQKLKMEKPASNYIKVCSQHFTEDDYIPRGNMYLLCKSMFLFKFFVLQMSHVK